MCVCVCVSECEGEGGGGGGGHMTMISCSGMAFFGCCGSLDRLSLSRPCLHACCRLHGHARMGCVLIDRQYTSGDFAQHARLAIDDILAR